MKVAFHSSYLGYRGTEVALMDYAKGNREILGNESMFLMPWREGGGQHPVAERMRGIAPLWFYRSVEERETILRDQGADFLYCIKNGFNDGVFSRKVTTGIHAIFRESEFHGDVYAYVSPWLSEVMAYGKAPWVPHMVSLSDEDEDLRTDAEGRELVVGNRWSEVSIPRDATVFGRHGGDDSFDIPWVQKAVVEIAKKNPDIWVLFLNTRKFQGAATLPNIRFLPATADPILKRKFLNTCDAMLHGRMRGETFGLSCLEFAMLGKPVLTYAGSPERAHLEILGDAAVTYQNAEELKQLLRHPASVIRHLTIRGQRTEDGGRRAEADPQPATNNQEPAHSSEASDSRFKQYQPEAVMKKFERVFLK
jgi:glycosyltransferase involved in cell wall biosynthesis